MKHGVLQKKGVKAGSHLSQWSADSAVDCVNAEIENFLSLCGNTTVHCRQWTTLKALSMRTHSKLKY